VAVSGYLFINYQGFRWSAACEASQQFSGKSEKRNVITCRQNGCRENRLIEIYSIIK